MKLHTILLTKENNPKHWWTKAVTAVEGKGKNLRLSLLSQAVRERANM